MTASGVTRRWGWAAVTLTAGGAVFLSSCGTVLYPERRGQPAGRLDVGVVALDGIGLLLFLVPGVIAFAVDFATGAIYLPPDCPPPAPGTVADLRTVQLDPAGLTPEGVAEVVRERTGQPVSLEPGRYRAMRLERLDQFTPEAVAELQAEPHADRVKFRAAGE